MTFADEDSTYLEAGLNSGDKNSASSMHIPDEIWGFETTTILGLIALFIGVFFITIGLF